MKDKKGYRCFNCTNFKKRTLTKKDIGLSPELSLTSGPICRTIKAFGFCEVIYCKLELLSRKSFMARAGNEETITRSATVPCDHYI